MRQFLILSRQHVILIVFGLLLVGVLIGVGFFEHSYADRFLPNISIGGELVSGKTFDEVFSRMKLVGEALKTTGIQLVVPADHSSTTITIPQQSVGLTSDVVVEYFNIGDYEAVIRNAFAVGHSGSVWHRIMDQVSLIGRTRAIALPVAIREPAVTSLLTREFDELLKKPNDANFARGAGGIAIVDEAVGERIDLGPVIAGVTQAITTMRTNRLQLTVLPEQPRVTKQKLTEILDFARDVAAHITLVLTYRDDKVYASGATLATWLSIKPEPGVSIVVRRDDVADFIRRNINERIDDAPQNSRFAMSETGLIETVPGKPGSVASIEATSAAIENILMQRYLATAFPTGTAGARLATETITLPVTFAEAAPHITAKTIAQFNIEDLIGTASTSFKGSTDSRKHNIKKGVERVSGLLIAPGEEFSLVKAVGEVSEEAGFEKEYVIKGDRSVKEAGGGLCQLATTVFRGALNSGLPITERQNHSYVVGYYGPGLDATIYGPYPDLRFVNDTGGYMLFQMRVSGDNLIAEFYGKKDKRQVTITTPVLSDYIDPPPDRFLPDVEAPWGQITCTDHARKGLTAEATYTVDYGGGNVKTQVFKSVYQPWPKICLVGVKVPIAPINR